MLLNLTLRGLDEVLKKEYTSKGNYYYKVYQGCKYQVELWGGNGGTGCLDSICSSYGGAGSYMKGEYTPSSTYEMYVIVGGIGGDAKDRTGGGGGFNGGGRGGSDSFNFDPAGGGGGASEIRRTDVLDTRMMVAGGGSGGVCGVLGAPGGRLGLNGIREIEGVSFGMVKDYGSGSNVGGDGNHGRICPGTGSGSGWVGGKSRDSIYPSQMYHEAIGYGGSNGVDANYVYLVTEKSGNEAPSKYNNGDGKVIIQILNPDDTKCKRPRPSASPSRSRSVSPSPSASPSKSFTPSASPSNHATKQAMVKKDSRGKMFVASIILSKGASRFSSD